MADLTGGKRDRMIVESVHRHIIAELTTLGWFTAGRKHQPISVVDEFPDLQQADVPLNTLAISQTDTYGVAAELGSKLEENYKTFYIDFFAENDGVGRHVAGDIYAFAKSNDVLQVYDYDDADSPEFTVEILHNETESRKPANVTRPWQKHWYTIQFTVEDMRSY